MKKHSIAKKYVLILVFSLLPFIIGIGYSLFQNRDRTYFSAAINISGSQRMRTMLLSNYSQFYVHSNLRNDLEDQSYSKDILLEERVIYEKFYHALKVGDSNLNMKIPTNENIKQKLLDLEPFINRYLANVDKLLIDYQDMDALRFVQDNAMHIKDQFHLITELFQEENDRSIFSQQMLDVSMLILALLITISGLLLTTLIRQQEYHANFDFLTKLKNRYSFYQDIKEKEPTGYSIFFIDLNKFKIINDTYGHQIGDEILVGVAQRLRDTFDQDLLYRFGGDEFIALLPENDNSSIDEKIEKLREKLAEPIIDSFGRNYFVGLALGVVASAVGISDWEMLIGLSDDLMYDSKSIAGHTIVFRTKKDLDYRIKLIESVDHVFKNGLIKLKYSPIIGIKPKANPIFNVSSRWIEGNQEYQAKEFIPLLKRKGYLPMLDKNTIKQLELDLNGHKKSNNKKSDYIISITEDTLVNVEERNFIEMISNIQIPKEQLYFKVQEEWLNNYTLLKQLELMKEAGFKVALDLNRLEIPLKDSKKYDLVNLIKLGNSLVKSLVSTDQTKVLMKEFVNLITDLNIIVVLEGLTIQENLDFIVSLNFRNKDYIYVDGQQDV